MVWFMVFNATFNNISVVSWLSVLLVEEIGVPAENHRLIENHQQALSYNVVSSTPRQRTGFELTTLGNCKASYYTIRCRPGRSLKVIWQKVKYNNNMYHRSRNQNIAHPFWIKNNVGFQTYNPLKLSNTVKHVLRSHP